MKNLKDSLKLIFTAVINLLMSLVPGKKISKAAEGSAYGNMQSVSGTTKNVEMTEKVMKEITKAFQNRISETDQKQFLKWKMYQYKPKETRDGKISIYKGQTYTNTG